ncbi:uncharacterized protein LOC117174497 isoform X1 [Belonocnema kinseyi]|uniref:uncharacterized protein LOC117174497 isoform X1 n=1 Tax=Belonocnema kinseyi TaxID=2817044 RepID=UPI00143DC473|nr:uncharacterized protein LOC117174497 isoform X1 [Belonocnema kinseyi]
MDATDLDDPMQTCPYDVSHRILKSRMQWHLVRCRKNHPDNKDQMRTCPYDAVHVVNSIEYEYHIANCPKSGTVLNFIFSSEGQRSVGSVSLEKSNSVYVPPTEENWDTDPPVPTYNPLQIAKNRNVLLSEIGLSKAKKRQFKNSERLRIQALEESGIHVDDLPQPVTEDPDKPLRKPHNKSQAMTLVSRKGKETLNDPEVRLRLPRTKSVAMSVCSNIDHEDEILDTKKFSNSTKLAETPASDKNAIQNSLDTGTDSATLFNSILKEAAKKVDQSSHVIMKHSSKQNKPVWDADLIVLNGEEVKPIDPRFLLSDLATSSSGSSSSSSITDGIDGNFGASYTNLTAAQNDIVSSPDSISIQCDSKPVLNSNGLAKNYPVNFINHSNDAIQEITSRLATVNTLEQSLEMEKAKLKQQVDEYYSSRGASRLRTNKNDTSTNPRCAANFSKANKDKESFSEILFIMVTKKHGQSWEASSSVNLSQ